MPAIHANHKNSTSLYEGEFKLDEAARLMAASKRLIDSAALSSDLRELARIVGEVKSLNASAGRLISEFKIDYFDAEELVFSECSK